MDGLIQDLRFALRQLRRSPGFTAAAVVTLALGIGANTAVFSVLDAALLEPLPVARPDRLVHLETQRPEGRVNAQLSHPLFAALADGATTLDEVVAMTTRSVGLTTGRGAVPATGEFVTPNYFATLGLRARPGRGFTPAEAARGDAVVVLSHAVWQRRFDADPGVLGATVELNDRPFTVTGVAPEGYHGLVRGRRTDFWAPLRSFPVVAPERWDAGSWFDEPAVSWLDVVGRLASGADLASARAELRLLDGRLREVGVRAEDESARLTGFATGLDRGVRDLATPLGFLAGVVGLVLLIACANVAGLLLARGTGRRTELAMRRSLGADRPRLIRQLLTESVALGALGGVAGLALSFWLMDVLAALRSPTGEVLALDVGPDGRVLAFTGAVSLVATIAFGLAPALRATGLDLSDSLKSASAGTRAPEGRFGLRDGLVVGQVALTVVLLVGAGLLLRSVRNLGRIDLTFEPDSVLLVQVDLAAQRYEPGPGREFLRGAAARVGGTPGVETAAWAATVHPSPAGSRFEEVELEAATGAPEAGGTFDVNTISPGYFETLRMPLLRGRAPTAGDGPEAPRVAVINRMMAEAYWPDADPLGRHLYLGDRDDPDAAVEIVGVAPDTRYRSLREAERNVVYLSVNQFFESTMTLLVRTTSDPSGLVGPIREQLRALDAGVPVLDVRTLADHVSLAASRERFAARLTSVFGVLALVLAGVGLYGVVAQLVARRTREIGVRVALGAEGRDVVGLVLRGALVLVGVGVVVGVAAALASARIVGGLLYGVASTDVVTLVAASTVVVGGTVVAVLVPVRRALSVQPARALRHE